MSAFRKDNPKASKAGRHVDKKNRHRKGRNSDAKAEHMHCNGLWECNVVMRMSVPTMSVQARVAGLQAATREGSPVMMAALLYASVHQRGRHS